MILSYASEIWADNEEVGESPEQLHTPFLKMYLQLKATPQPPLFC